MNNMKITALLFAVTLISGAAHATERMTCDSGDKSTWKSEAELIEKITAEG
jgi:outer membrane biogenesis lipoprotein LolB